MSRKNVPLVLTSGLAVSSRNLQGYLAWIQAAWKPSFSKCEVLNPTNREDFNT